MSNIVESIAVAFHDQNIPNIPNFNIPNDQFGCLKFKITNEKPINNYCHYVFTIDISTSMDILCADGKSKLDHIKYTLKAMMKIFAANDTLVSFSIIVFNNEAKLIIENEYVLDATIENIFEIIDNKLYAQQTTDIEMALNKAYYTISDYRDMHNDSSSDITHIFMTDGEINVGSSDINLLSDIVKCTHCQTIFIGFGVTHDANLLTQLAQNDNCSYYFIDKISKSSLVYGEIIHDVLYTLAKQVKITVTNGEIYNYKTNKWSGSIFIGSLVSGSQKQYQIKSCTREQIQIVIENRDIILRTISFDGYCCDLTDYKFRHITQEMLYFSNQLSKVYSVMMQTKDDIEKRNEKICKFKIKLLKLYEGINRHMIKNKKRNDSFLKTLCNDLFIVYNTIDKKYSNMYSISRQISQGEHRVYQVDTLEEYPGVDNMGSKKRPSKTIDEPHDNDTPNFIHQPIKRPINQTASLVDLLAKMVI